MDFTRHTNHAAGYRCICTADRNIGSVLPLCYQLPSTESRSLLADAVVQTRNCCGRKGQPHPVRHEPRAPKATSGSRRSKQLAEAAVLPSLQVQFCSTALRCHSVTACHPHEVRGPTAPERLHQLSGQLVSKASPPLLSCQCHPRCRHPPIYDLLLLCISGSHCC